MQAIQVKYLGATNSKGNRLKAIACCDESVTLSYNYELEANDNARVAALELIKKLEWNVVISGEGMLRNGDYAFTLRGA